MRSELEVISTNLVRDNTVGCEKRAFLPWFTLVYVVKFFGEVSIKEIDICVAIEPANILNHIVRCEMVYSMQYILNI